MDHTNRRNDGLAARIATAPLGETTDAQRWEAACQEAWELLQEVEDEGFLDPTHFSRSALIKAYRRDMPKVWQARRILLAALNGRFTKAEREAIYEAGPAPLTTQGAQI